MARDGERGRGDFKARPGSQNSGPYAEASGDSGPVDIAAVRRDDALIDAISGDGPVQTGDSEEYQLAALLANWRAEIVAEPMPAGPDLDAIVAAVNQEIGARQARIGASSRGRLRLVRPLLGAAAAMALVIGGLTAFSYNASPGDPLWKMKEVVFSEQAQSTVVSQASSDIDQAQQLIAAGKPEEAKAVMQRAADSAGQVNDTTKKNDLIDRWQQALTQLQAVAPTVANGMDKLVPTTTPKAPTTVPTAATTPGENPTVTVNPNPNPTILGTPVEPDVNPTTPGGISQLPTVPPVTSVPVQPPSTEPVQPTAPTVGGSTSTASLPTGGNTGGGTNPGGGHEQPQPPVEKPQPPVVVPTTIAVPPPASIVPPVVPVVPGVH